MHIHKHSHSQQQIVENNQNFAKQKRVYTEKRKISFRSLQQISCDCVFSFWSCSSIEFIHCKYSLLISFYCSVLFCSIRLWGFYGCMRVFAARYEIALVCVRMRSFQYRQLHAKLPWTRTHTHSQRRHTFSCLCVWNFDSFTYTHTHMTHGKWY